MKFILYLIKTNWDLIRQALNKKKTENGLKNVIAGINKLTVVKSGPFVGMRYPKALAYGSSFFPKILGTYEKEIQDYIAALKDRSYDTVIDIGCAEGYYAVGLKKMFPNAKVYAIDINANARKFCKEMAKLNNCLHDFTIAPSADHSFLKSIVTNNTLIVSDCEGYEAILFNSNNYDEFSRCDLIIETHDFIDPSISVNLEQRFSKTHSVVVVQSLDDNLKAKYYQTSEIKDLDFQKKKYLLSENRPQTMEWLICQKN